MDPITTAIVAGIGIGAISGTTKVAEQSIIDAYSALKTLIVKKFSKDSGALKAVQDLESKPDSRGRRATLNEEIESAGVANDPEIIIAANNLLDLIKQLPSGEQHIQTAIGSYIAQADRGSSAAVNVGDKD